MLLIKKIFSLNHSFFCLFESEISYQVYYNKWQVQL